MNLIETFDLCKKYSSHLVIDHVNMHVEEGQIYGFVGENGSGKTTIMRLISGLAEPTSGTYSLFGVSSKSFKIAKARRNMAAIVEATSIVPTMTAKENMRYQAIYLNLKQSEEERNELLKKVHLEDVGKKKAKNFSLGMKQRLGIALALMVKPKLLMLDEPLNGLDPQGIAELRELLIELNKNERITILISSHILSELEKVASTSGFISHGKLIKEISAKELAEQCRKSLSIVPSDPSKFENLLNKENITNYKAYPTGEIKIFDDVDITSLITKMAKEKISILQINTSDENVEDYYLNMIKGGN